MTDLIEISNNFIPQDIDYFNENECIEVLIMCLDLIDTFIIQNEHAIAESEFEEALFEDISELIMIHFDDDILFTESAEIQIEDIIEYAISFCLNEVMPQRECSILTHFHPIAYNYKEITLKQIEYLKSKPQPSQRTLEWYTFRNNLITASNAWKAFDSQSSKNQLIYEKCQLRTSQDSLCPVNVNSTLHWGQKYEPMSVLIYEHKNCTTVGDFGCIQHDQYDYIGASPDGINIDPMSERFGIMLEIKNIVNREITGIPKKEYWIQTQLQMEVCNLDKCDFLETKFTEYENANAFFEDDVVKNNVANELVNDNTNELVNDNTNELVNDNTNELVIENGEFTKTGKMKGIILYFNKTGGIPFYVYKPINIVGINNIAKWIDDAIDKYQSLNIMWISNIYWKLDEYSCVLILRNKEWFASNVKFLQEIWDIIKVERISGYAHRAPKRKPAPTKIVTINNEETKYVCLININNKFNIVKQPDE